MAKKPSKGNGRAIPKVEIPLEISKEQGKYLLETLKDRFGEKMDRHKGLEWSKIQAKLNAHPEKLLSLFGMESTGGEPDVVGYDKKTGEFIFYDCSNETPDRRSICYDRKGEAERNKKGIFPGGNAVDLATEMGIRLLTIDEYRGLQELGGFDLKTSSWVETPENIRELGGALFADRRYDTVFVYHNGAQSFYGARGFRGLLRV